MCLWVFHTLGDANFRSVDATYLRSDVALVAADSIYEGRRGLHAGSRQLLTGCGRGGDGGRGGDDENRHITQMTIWVIPTLPFFTHSGKSRTQMY